MTVFDEIAETDGRREEGKAGELIRFLKSSFNPSICIRFSDGGPNAIIRFPKPGHTAIALIDEKATNEAQFMKYLRKNTIIPLPRMISWGLTEESPQQLEPFIVMDYADGTRLSTILKQPTEDDQEDVLNYGAIP